MKTEIFAKFFKQSLRRKLYWALCILLVLTVLTSWSVVGVYAKYIDAVNGGDSAGVASMGVTEFKLIEHEANPIDDDDLAAMLEADGLYKLDFTKTVLNNTYSKVIPGVDIPKDPFIELQIASNEVSYELYLDVKEIAFPTYTVVVMEDGEPKEVEFRPIDYVLTKDWEKADDSEAKAGLYKYVGKVTGTKYEMENGIFEAVKPYTFKYSTVKADDTSIHILEGDKIKVSEHFNSELVNAKPIEFSLKFTAYLKQVINTNKGEVEDGDGD